uniref:EOG090X06MA n=1 Tax=Alona affinis TaxID=381656 RepID=A0A9N6ZES1_9CRUS|nr:EOG090X06MA [Alona affinis]
MCRPAGHHHANPRNTSALRALASSSKLVAAQLFIVSLIVHLAKLSANFVFLFILCFAGDLQRCRPFLVAGKQVGVMQPRVLEAALRHPDVFLLDASSGSVWMHPSLVTYEERSARINAVLSQWREEGSFVTLKGWRDECYEVRTGFADPPLLKMERSATCLFGIRQYGVEINGYTRHPQLGICLWLQRRSFSKPTWPGKWDNMVAGGLSVGHSVLDTALKEADEEASIPPHLLLNLKSAGSVSFYFESERGLFPNTELVYDLELPPDFVPRNADGEVDSFELVPVDQVMERLLTPDYKTTSCPTTLDFLIRHGHLNPDNEPNLPELVELLHIPLHYLYNNHGGADGGPAGPSS